MTGWGRRRCLRLLPNWKKYKSGSCFPQGAEYLQNGNRRENGLVREENPAVRILNRQAYLKKSEK